MAACASDRSVVKDSAAAACAVDHKVAVSSPAAVFKESGSSGCAIRTRLFSRRVAQNLLSASAGADMLPFRTNWYCLFVVGVVFLWLFCLVLSSWFCFWV